MAQFTSPLKNLNVAAPCSANWDEMFSFEGERIRYCSQCKLNVYNLSAMKQSEAETLIMRAEGRLCVRFYRRADGSILTQNCPVGLQALKARLSRRAQFVLGMVLGLLANIGLFNLKDTILPTRYVTQGAIYRPEIYKDLKTVEDQLRTLREEKADEIIMGKAIRPMGSDKNSPKEGARLKLPTGKRREQQGR